jgi:hypothetical protein
MGSRIGAPGCPLSVTQRDRNGVVAGFSDIDSRGGISPRPVESD